MKSAALFSRLLGLAVLPALSSCSYIKNWFPDKGKDYQYTTEIPELVIPADLKNAQALSLPIPTSAPAETSDSNQPTPEQTEASVQPAQTSAAVTAIAENNTSANNQAAESVPAEETVIEPTAASVQPDSNQAPVKREPIQVELVKTAEQISLRMHAPFVNAWRAIDKALSRKSLEVTSRNIEEKRFNVQYDADEHKLEDSSIWDEAAFIFGGFQGNEKAYTLKLVETNSQTDVIVLDAEQKPATDAGATGLLNLLQETIKTDFAK